MRIRQPISPGFLKIVHHVRYGGRTVNPAEPRVQALPAQAFRKPYKCKVFAEGASLVVQKSDATG